MRLVYVVFTVIQLMRCMVKILIVDEIYICSNAIDDHWIIKERNLR